MDDGISEGAKALGAELNALMVGLRAVMAEAAARFHPDLQPAAFQIAVALAYGPTKAGRLAEQLHMDKSAVSRLAKALCDAGLASASADPDDGRGIVYALTGRGVERLDAANALKSNAYMRRLEGWSGDDMALLAGLLRRFTTSPSAAARG